MLHLEHTLRDSNSRLTLSSIHRQRSLKATHVALIRHWDYPPTSLHIWCRFYRFVRLLHHGRLRIKGFDELGELGAGLLVVHNFSNVGFDELDLAFSFRPTLPSNSLIPIFLLIHEWRRLRSSLVLHVVFYVQFFHQCDFFL